MTYPTDATDVEAPTGVFAGHVADAIAYAVEAHDRQRRKGTDIPYASHLLAVAALVMEHSGTPAQACAAVLHDVVEDCGGLARLADVRDRFGEDIAEMVEALSDSTTDDPDAKPPWRDRKEAYLARLRAGRGAPSMLVSLADKTHNAEAIVADLTDPDGSPGLSVFERFSANATSVAWFYLELAAAFTADTALPRRLTDRLRAAAITIHDYAAQVPVEIGASKELAAGHAVWAGTWGLIQVEPLEVMEAAVARFRLARTVGDILNHPTLAHDRFEELLTWDNATGYFPEEFPEPTSKAHEKRLKQEFTQDGDTLRHDLPLWDGWDLAVADEVEYPPLPDVPWESAGGGNDYSVWAPASVQALVDDGELTSPMQEVTRDDLMASVDEVEALLADAGWTVVDGGGRYADVAFGIERPYGGGWTLAGSRSDA